MIRALMRSFDNFRFLTTYRVDSPTYANDILTLFTSYVIKLI